MSRKIIQYDLLISCPGDIKSELTLIEKAVSDFNTTFSDALGISIRTMHWSKNSYAQSGGRPQTLLNEQFVRDCDAAVALLWTRFGTPTDQYGSGTEEEIEIMLEAGKQVFMYFSDKPISPSAHNPAEYERVNAFRKKYKDRGIYFTYSSDEEFSQLFFAHLSQHFLAEKKVAEVKAERKSKLRLMGITQDDILQQNAVFQDFFLAADRTTDGDIEEIRSIICEASKIHLQTTFSERGLGLSLNKAVEISNAQVDVISAVAKLLEIDLPKDFFCLGNLTEEFNLAHLSRANYDGTEEEIRKYELLTKLYEKIVDFSEWQKVLDNFHGISCVRLALSNTGTAVDEDIDITLKVPQSAFRTLDELPLLSEETMKYLTDDCDMDTIFGIKCTAEFNDYDSSLLSNRTPSVVQGVSDIFGQTDYAQNYRNVLEDIFCYDVYQTGNVCVIKLKFDYIKHHTSIAFPSAILLKEPVKSIPYTITSKNSAEIIEGTIQVV